MSRVRLRKRPRSVGPQRIIGKEMDVVLHRRAAACRVRDDEIALLKSLDGAPRQVFRLLLVAGVQHQRAAAPHRWWRDDVVALGRKDPGRRLIDVTEERSLNAALKQTDAPPHFAKARGELVELRTLRTQAYFRSKRSESLQSRPAPADRAVGYRAIEPKASRHCQ